MDTINIGLIGCGVISDAYLKGAARSPVLSVKSVTDLRADVAKAKAEAHGVEAVSLEAMLEDPDITVILNLTVPAAHTEINRRAIAAGKHVYSEKPLGITFAEADAMVREASRAGLRIGCAPDTFLGGGHQAVRQLIDEGAIGTVTGGSVTFATAGPDVWHPSPFFFFERGGGPMLDIGCYPLTQLVNCLGPISSVIADATRPQAVRSVGAGPQAGDDIKVDVFTTMNGAFTFANGASISFTVSWDVWKHRRPPIEFYGSEGTIENPDPNFFGGPVTVSNRAGAWENVSLGDRPFCAPNRTTHDGRALADYRMIGLVDMATAIAQGRPHRASGALALHVLEAMEAAERSAVEGVRIALTTTCERPEPVPLGDGEAVFVRA